jgi:NADH-quinone oxidoreductase subunit J
MPGQVSSHPFLAAGAGLAQVSATPLVPVVLLILCLVAGVGTVMLLPSRREASYRTMGAVVLLVAALIFVALLVRWTAGTGGMGAYFWIFSAVALVGAVRVVTHTKPVYSALYFVLTVLATAGLFLLLWAEFMAAALVLIYAGAILVTYVFVIMLAAEATSPQATSPAGGTAAKAGGVLSETDTVSREPLAASAVGFALMGVLLFVIFDKAQAVPRAGDEPGASAEARLARQTEPATDEPRAAEGQPPPPRMAGATQELGAYLFRNQLVNLELAGLILTVSMVGAIVIARKRVVGDPAAAESAGMLGAGEVIVTPATPINDDPHSIPVYGTTNPRQKEYPET